MFDVKVESLAAVICGIGICAIARCGYKYVGVQNWHSILSLVVQLCEELPSVRYRIRVVVMCEDFCTETGSLGRSRWLPIGYQLLHSYQ
jgi:hypothetical protein